MSGLQADVVVRQGGFTCRAELSAAPGEVVAVLGPNGSGKTTLLRALAGLLPVVEGRVAVDGTLTDDAVTGLRMPVHLRPVSLVFPDHRLFPHLRALDNVAFGLRAHGVPRQAARAQAAEWLSLLGVGSLSGRRPGELSGGQAQRVALARALAVRPRLLLLDEPLAALDAATTVEARGVLAEHLSDGTTASVLVTHDPLDAMVLAASMLVLEGGRVVQRGTPAEVARRPATAYVARLMGLTLHAGVARGGEVALDDGGHLVVADHPPAGRVLVAVRPSTVTVHVGRPEGSARNVWQATVTGMELLGDRVRLATSGTPPVLADVTPAAVSDLALAPGREVWVSVKATELEAYPEPGSPSSWAGDPAGVG